MTITLAPLTVISDAPAFLGECCVRNTLRQSNKFAISAFAGGPK